MEEIQTQKIEAIKLFKKDINSKRSENEAQLLLSISHPKIITGSQYYPKVLIPLPIDINAPDFSFPCECYSALVLEYVPNGDLLELITSLNYLPEVLARTYFHQLVDAIDYIHNAGICHLDLRPENVLMDQNYSLKLSDFGLSLKCQKTSFIKDVAGTIQYFSPEMHEDNFYSGFQADLFALGIILFAMVSGMLPFVAAKPSDSIYGLIAQRNFQEFWKIHESLMRREQQFFSTSFQDLIQGMLEHNPKKRFSLTDIKDHPWYKGSTIKERDLGLFIESVLGQQKSLEKTLTVVQSSFS